MCSLLLLNLTLPVLVSNLSMIGYEMLLSLVMLLRRQNSPVTQIQTMTTVAESTTSPPMDITASDHLRSDAWEVFRRKK